MAQLFDNVKQANAFIFENHTKSRIELHLHLEGSVRPQTIYELANAKQYRLTENNSLEEIEKAITVDTPVDLAYFISKIDFYLPLLVGDVGAIERITYELCESQWKENVLYFEVRFSPHLLSNTIKHFFVSEPIPSDSPTAVTADDALCAVIKGLDRGLRDFGIHARIILCTIKGQDGWSFDVLRMATEFALKGVVAIDIAGDEGRYSEEERSAFEKAKQLNIHRTVHSGETGPATNILYAVDKLHAERIGHGYHVIDDQDIYEMCKNRNIHFETCPYSSYYTGAVKATEKHPIVTFAEENVNFSISKDDSTQTKSTLDSEYELLRQMGLNELHLIRANFNAARSCFLPDAEKKALIECLKQAYGVAL